MNRNPAKQTAGFFILVEVVRKWQQAPINWQHMVSGSDTLRKDVAETNNLLKSISDGVNARINQLIHDRDAWKRRAEAAEKELEGDCGICANAHNCQKYPNYCINGSAFKLRDLCAGNGSDKYE